MNSIKTGARGAGSRTPSAKALRGLDALNFFLADVRDGFVSLEAARDVYKVAIRDGAIDEASTQQLRATR